MKLTVKIAALLLVLTTVIPILFACKNNGDKNNETPNNDIENTPVSFSEESYIPEAEKGIVTAPATDAKIYNVIFALATVPPVLAALEAIDSGYETYALIERGKTYNGIDSIEGFHNVGFDPTSNESNGFTYEEFNTMVDKLRELRAAEENSFFYIYAQDGTALRAAALAANAGIPVEDFHVIMCEDGSGTYKSLREYFIEGVADPLQKFLTLLNDVGPTFNRVMSKSDNKNADEDLKYNISSAFALSVLPNFTYWLQDSENVAGILGNSNLAPVFGLGDPSSVEFSANLRYMTIADKIDELNDDQRADYLTLMYGSYYEETYAALTRTARGDKPAPDSKLVFIGARHGYYPKFASDEKYGIGGIGKDGVIPESYTALGEKYKNQLLFATEGDYNILLAVINDASNYPADAPAEVIAQMKAECFDLYIDYIFTLKFTYALYGKSNDIILKGHPREVLGASEEWSKRYNVTHVEVEGDGLKETKYCYDKLLDAALCAFHEKDSIGKLIGTVPYGTAAENLAYLGAPITVCGLPSSTYSGLDTGVDVLFIICETDESICGDDSQVKDRFNAGNLTYDVDGEQINCIFYNNGNVCKSTAEIFKDSGDSTTAAEFEKLFAAWLAANRPGSNDIDEQGFAK